MPRTDESSRPASQVTPKSIRVEDAVMEKFKKLVSDGDFPSQNQALQALITCYEIDKGRAILPDMKMDIDDFQAHVDAILQGFLHALELNNGAENRIRNEFSTSIASKDKTIASLQGQVEDQNRNIEYYKSRYREMSDEAASSRKAQEKADRLLEESERAHAQTLADKEKIIDSLEEARRKDAETIKTMAQAQTQNQARLDACSALEHENQVLKEENSALQQALRQAEEAASVQMEMAKRDAEFEKEKVLFDMQKDFQQQINEIKEAHQQQIRELQMEYSQQIRELLGQSKK